MTRPAAGCGALPPSGTAGAASGGGQPVVYRTAFIRRADVWFRPAQAPAADVIRCLQTPAPVPGMRSSEFFTLLLDLRQSEADLSAGLDAGLRREIRRAGRDDLACERRQPSSDAAAREFSDFYDRFARHKGLPRMNRSRLLAYARAGVLDLSCVRAGDGATLVWHAHYRCEARARLLFSASLYREQTNAAYRQAAGRANRFLHWWDLLRMRDEDMHCFDFGGWDPSEGDPEKRRISRFKEEFGGRPVREFNGEAAVTLRGRLFLWARAMAERRRAGGRRAGGGTDVGGGGADASEPGR